MSKTIFDPVNAGGFQAPNRIMAAATWHALSDEEGHITPQIRKIYRDLARGGVGLIDFESTGVRELDGRAQGVTRLDRDELIPEFSALVKEVHAEGVPIIIQLALNRFIRKKDDGSLQFVPVSLITAEEIGQLKTDFTAAAVRAKKAGFDGVQIHAAHGTLLGNFLSPDINRREDAFAGSLENRARLLVDILHGIKQECGQDFPVSVKINSTDRGHAYGGFEPDDCVRTCILLETEGIDAIEVSINGPSEGGIRAGRNEAFLATYAKAIRSHVSVPVIMTGGLRSMETMDRLLNEGVADMFSLSRPLIREPDLVNRWKSGDTAPARCVSCNRCFSMAGHTCALGVARQDENAQ
jgi:2,4-dienoyl-CoA reductase-like NADH-dependent reductase (Old Yellow Enzyme family)